jgi:hypothetical protein
VDWSAVPAGQPPVTEGELQIGGATEHGDDFKGRIDEVRIYNRALDRKEVEDRVSPSFSHGFPVSVFPEETSATVMLAGAYDAGFPGGLAPLYAFRYTVNSTPFSFWRLTDGPHFSVTIASETTEIRFRVYATDAIGFRSHIEEATVLVESPEPYELDEEAQAEAEEVANGAEQDNDPFAVANLFETGEAETTMHQARAVKPGPGQCKVTANKAHPSVTEFRKGFNRIAATSFIECGPPLASGFVQDVLYRVVGHGAYEPVKTGKWEDLFLKLRINGPSAVSNQSNVNQAPMSTQGM